MGYTYTKTDWCLSEIRMGAGVLRFRLLSAAAARTFKSRVSLLSRKLMYLLLLLSLSALMQLPSASRERLMWAPSFMRCPRFCVCGRKQGV